MFVILIIGSFVFVKALDINKVGIYIDKRDLF